MNWPKMRKFFGFILLLVLFEYPAVSLNHHPGIPDKKPDLLPRPAPKDYKSDFELARDYINNGQYQEALPILLRLLKDDAQNSNLNFLVGYCYINMETEKNKALPYLEKAVVNTVADYNDNSSKEKNAPVYAFLYLGIGYHQVGKLDEALSNLEKFRGFLLSKTGKLINQKNYDVFNEVNIRIEQVKNAKKLMASPLSIEFVKIPLVNAGNYSSYGSQLTHDEKAVYYTRERLNDKIRGRSDMYVLRKTGKNWTKNEQAGQNLNGPYNDIFNSISQDSKFLLFSSDRKGVFNIFYSMQDNNKWTEPYDNLSINSNFNETYAVLSNDGKKMIFVSDRPGGFGGKDLYITTKKPDGAWTQPENMGFTVNTPFDEDTPWLSDDGNTLYFSSEGHASMGGSDVFYSVFKNNMWMEPINMGYPINSVSNDLYFKWFPQNNLITLSSNRKNGGNNYEILAARYTDSTRVGEVFKGTIEIQAEDTVSPLKENAPKITRDSLISEDTTKKTITKPAEKPLPSKDTMAKAETLQSGRKAISDSIVKARQKKISDSLTQVRIAKAKEELKQKRQLDQAAAAKARQDSINVAREKERKSALVKAAQEKIKQEQFNKEKARVDSLAQVRKTEEENTRLALQKVALEDSLKQLERIRETARLDSISRDNKQKEEIARVATEKKMEEKQAADKAAANKLAAEKQASDKAAADKLAAEKIAAEKEIKKTAEGKLIRDTAKQAGIKVQAQNKKYILDSLAKVKKQSEETLARYLESEKQKLKEITEKPGKNKIPALTQKAAPKITKPAGQKSVTVQPAGEGFPPCKPASAGAENIYTVQVGAGWMKIKYFKSIQDKRICYGPDGLARFIVGTFTNLKEAEEMRDNMRLLGFADAWIPEVDEKRCVCPDNELLINAHMIDKITTAETGANIPRYTIQVGAGNMKVKYFKNLRQVRVCTGKDGIIRFIIGEFTNLDEATIVRDKIVKMGYWDAWIPLIDENRCLSGSSSK